jgi:hypothetical protein
MLWILELFDTGFEAGDSFTKELRACLALAIVVLAEAFLFRTNALLTGRFRAITAHFSLPAAKTCFASLESGRNVAGWGRRIVVGHYRKIRRIR